MHDITKTSAGKGCVYRDGDRKKYKKNYVDINMDKCYGTPSKNKRKVVIKYESR